MDREEFISINNIEDGTIILEPFDIFKKGIVGVNEERNKIIYSYQGLVQALAESYEKEWNENEENKLYEKPDFYFDACEWLDCNTLRSLPYMGENKPEIIYEVEL